MARNIGTDANISKVRLAEQASDPATPASGFGKVYAKTDGKLYFISDAGTVYKLTSSISGAIGQVVVFGSADSGVGDNDLFFETPILYVGTAGAAGIGSADSGRKLRIVNKAPDSTNEWGMSTTAVGGGTRLEIVDADAENTNDQPMVWIENKHDGNWPGSGDPSVPVGIYAQHTQTGSNTAFTHTIMALAINDGTGDNDVVAVSGRAKKDGAGVGDAAGVFGSAYNNVNQNGGVMGTEGAIYQNVAGMVAADSLGAKWSAAIHAISDSTGSDATAGVAIDGNSANTYRFWNGVLIDGNAFRGSGTSGTVGLNMSDAYPEYGVKFGSATRHIYGTGAITVGTAGSGDIEFYPDGNGVSINGSSKSLAMKGTAGGGASEGITYKDSGSTQRYGLMFPGSNVVALANRASNGVVQIRANTSTAGDGGEITAVEVQDDRVEFLDPDVAHGVTTIAQTTAYGQITATSGTDGGLRLYGLSQATNAINPQGIATTDDTTKSTAGIAPITLNAAKANGTGVQDVGADANIWALRMNGSTRAIIDEDGDLHLDATSNENAWDEYDDIGLLSGLRALAMVDGAPLKAELQKWVEYARPILEKTGVVTFNDDGHHFVSTKGLNMLMIDAMRQMAGKITELEGQLRMLSGSS